MSHRDICPCKHGRMVCRGSCLYCCAELYGTLAAAEIVERDGLAPFDGTAPHISGVAGQDGDAP